MSKMTAVRVIRRIAELNILGSLKKDLLNVVVTLDEASLLELEEILIDYEARLGELDGVIGKQLDAIAAQSQYDRDEQSNIFSTTLAALQKV